jgi:alkyl sulfatase BDS1-like metallo-beta-lactamase superfamily hydrolase
MKTGSRYRNDEFSIYCGYVGTMAVTTTRPVFESVILGQRTLADAMEHHEITTAGDAKAVSDLLALLFDFKPGFPVVEPGR